MKTIWKFPIANFWKDDLNIPRGAQVVHVAIQDAVPTVWAEVDLEREFVTRHVAVFGTGLALPDVGWTHAGTVLDGLYVWHVYLQDDPQ